jgi:hypothetical protein
MAITFEAVAVKLETRLLQRLQQKTTTITTPTGSPAPQDIFVAAAGA